MVTIHVDGRDFLLPRGLLCYNSEFFDRALNGYCGEATQDHMTLPRCSVETLELIIQWFYNAQIVLQARKAKSQSNQDSESQQEAQTSDERPNYVLLHRDISDDNEEENDDSERDARETPGIDRGNVQDTKAQDISRLLAFLKLADRIILLGPFDSVVATIKALILGSRDSLQAEHIRSAAELPAGHGVRKLFA